MATPFFGKRDPEPALAGSQHALRQPATPYGAGSTQGASSNASSEPTSAKPAPSSTPHETLAKLTVGPNIKLKGVEITDCDTLVVEGLVEATMDSRVIQIAEQGAFKGSAEIDLAEIRGEFSGTLTVRQKLVIYSTGKVTGTIRYGKLVIEEGGQLAGEISFGTQGKPAALQSVTGTPANAATLVRTA
jgi:cytoskeletal protein CcmA (bactofilin family)